MLKLPIRCKKTNYQTSYLILKNFIHRSLSSFRFILSEVQKIMWWHHRG